MGRFFLKFLMTGMRFIFPFARFSGCMLIWGIIIKFPYNARSDWLKQRALSENRERVNDIKLAFKFFPRNFDKIDPN